MKLNVLLFSTIVAAATAVVVLSASAGFAQAASPAAPANLPPAAKILDAATEASGGAKAFAKITSEVSSGTLELTAQKITGKIQETLKMPDKLLSVGDIQGIGHTAQGYDGKVGWSTDPMNGLRLLTGPELVQMHQQVEDLKSDWRHEFKKVEMIGLRKVGTSPAYAIRLTPNLAGAKPVVNFYDVKTKLLVRSDMTLESPQGAIPTQNFFSDYRTVSGVKIPFQSRQVLGMQEMQMRLDSVKFNVPVDDSVFKEPAAPPAAAAKP